MIASDSNQMSCLQLWYRSGGFSMLFEASIDCFSSEHNAQSVMLVAFGEEQKVKPS